MWFSCWFLPTSSGLVLDHEKSRRVIAGTGSVVSFLPDIRNVAVVDSIQGIVRRNDQFHFFRSDHSWIMTNTLQACCKSLHRRQICETAPRGKNSGHRAIDTVPIPKGLMSFVCSLVGLRYRTCSQPFYCRTCIGTVHTYIHTHLVNFFHVFGRLSRYGMMLLVQ